MLPADESAADASASMDSIMELCAPTASLHWSVSWATVWRCCSSAAASSS